MKYEIHLIRAFGKNEAGLADLPFQLTGTLFGSLCYGGQDGCVLCFPHGTCPETYHQRKPQRSWKVHRRHQWK